MRREKNVRQQKSVVRMFAEPLVAMRTDVIVQETLAPVVKKVRQSVAKG